MTDFGSTCIYYNQRYLANINIKGFLWLAGWSNYKPVFFHWRHEWTPSEFSFGPVFHPASPSGYEITALMNYINHNFPINPGEGWKKRTWFSSSLSDAEILSDSKHNSMFVVGWLKSWRLRGWVWSFGGLAFSSHELKVYGFKFVLVASNIWTRNQWVLNFVFFNQMEMVCDFFFILEILFQCIPPL